MGKTNKGWTSKMQTNAYPEIYDKNSHIRPSEFGHGFPKKNEECSPDTALRKIILEEIEKRCANGESLSKITADIASRKNVQDTFIYFIKNNINLSQVFQNWYNAKKKNSPIIDRIEGRI